MAARNIARWEKKYPTAIVRLFVEDAHSTQRSKEKREVYAAWLSEHPKEDRMKEYSGVFGFFFDIPASVLGAITIAPEPCPTTEEGRPPDPDGDLFTQDGVQYFGATVEDHPGLGDSEVEYVVNKPQEERRKDWGPWSW